MPGAMETRPAHHEAPPARMAVGLLIVLAPSDMYLSSFT